MDNFDIHGSIITKCKLQQPKLEDKSDILYADVN